MLKNLHLQIKYEQDPSACLVLTAKFEFNFYFRYVFCQRIFVPDITIESLTLKKTLIFSVWLHEFHIKSHYNNF